MGGRYVIDLVFAEVKRRECGVQCPWYQQQRSSGARYTLAASRRLISDKETVTGDKWMVQNHMSALMQMILLSESRPCPKHSFLIKGA